MQQPQASLLDGGQRLHLHHGPIDLIIGAEGAEPGSRQRAFEAAHARFQTVLDGLAEELALLRAPQTGDSPVPDGPVAKRMHAAAQPFCETLFVTPMIAVAGSVADEILAEMTAAAPLRRAYVNNGGDIAVRLSAEAAFSIAMAEAHGSDLGRIRFTGADGISGVATSGAKGRSHSFGIADSVTVLAASAAQADAAATLIANAVDLPGHPGIRRVPACDLQPDSDLAGRPVVTHVPPLRVQDCAEALTRGQTRAAAMVQAGLIRGAALFLQGQTLAAGEGFAPPAPIKELTHV